MRFMQNRHAQTMRLVRVCRWWSHCLQMYRVDRVTGLVASNKARSPFWGMLPLSCLCRVPQLASHHTAPLMNGHQRRN